MILINDAELKNIRFPNGELKVDGAQIRKLLNNYDGVTRGGVTFYYHNDADLLELYLVGKHIIEFEGDFVPLYIKYMPYSRMDRAKSEDDVFTLKYVAQLINSIGFKNVTILEPHSDVTMALINGAHAEDFIKMAFNRIDMLKQYDVKDTLFFPDASAAKRYEGILVNPCMVGIKHRDWTTGKITRYELVGGEGINNRKVFIVDDLCAKGTTAYHAALSLKAYGFRDINLVVAHCEDSIFDGVLLHDLSPINFIYTTDSILTKKHDKIVVL